MVGRLDVLLAAIVAGFALIGLSYLIPFPGLSLVLFVVGSLIVIVFVIAVVLKAIGELFAKQGKRGH